MTDYSVYINRAKEHWMLTRVDLPGGFHEARANIEGATQVADLLAIIADLQSRLLGQLEATYLVYDPEDGCQETFSDRDAAVEYANNRIPGYVENEFWDERVAAITVSMLTDQVVGTVVGRVPDVYDDEIATYELRPA